MTLRAESFIHACSRRLADSNCCIESPHLLRVNRAEQREGFVYIAEAGDRIKIGWTSQPDARIRRLESAIGEQVYVWACVPGTLADERRLHKEWHSQSLGGDWFTISDDLLIAAENIAARGAVA